MRHAHWSRILALNRHSLQLPHRGLSLLHGHRIGECIEPLMLGFEEQRRVVQANGPLRFKSQHLSLAVGVFDTGQPIVSWSILFNKPFFPDCHHPLSNCPATVGTCLTYTTTPSSLNAHRPAEMRACIGGAVLASPHPPKISPAIKFIRQRRLVNFPEEVVDAHHRPDHSAPGVQHCYENPSPPGTRPPEAAMADASLQVRAD